MKIAITFSLLSLLLADTLAFRPLIEVKDRRRVRREVKSSKASKSAPKPSSTASSSTLTTSEVEDGNIPVVPIESDAPSDVPSSSPTASPSSGPTLSPTSTPTTTPSASPTMSPTTEPMDAVEAPIICETKTLIWHVYGDSTNYIMFGNSGSSLSTNSLSYNVLDEDLLTTVGTYSDFGSDTANGDCLFTGVYSFDIEDGVSGSQLFIQGTCMGRANIITGGTGKFSCATGTQTLSEMEDMDYLASTLNICYTNCPF